MSPKANGMLSQLACRLDGIHVDLDRERRKSDIQTQVKAFLLGVASSGILDPLHLMRGYFRRAALTVADASEEARIAVSDMYEDDAGLGRMNTLTFPVFYQPHDDCPAIHYGVVGADMRLSEYKGESIWTDTDSFKNEVTNWNEHAECVSVSVDPCHLQVLREKDAQCVYPLERPENEKCFRFKEHIYYVEESEVMKLEEAKEHCLSLSGQMIAPQDIEERHFLATLIPPDGAWINITVENEIEWMWPNGARVEQNEKKNIQRTCDYPVPPGFFMDPREYENNIQCVQHILQKAVVCRFDAHQNPEVCGSNVVLFNLTCDDGLFCSRE